MSMSIGLSTVTYEDIDPLAHTHRNCCPEIRIPTCQQYPRMCTTTRFSLPVDLGWIWGGGVPRIYFSYENNVL